MSWFTRSFGYGLGATVGKALFGDDKREGGKPAEPIRSMTEAEIQADEKRFAEDARRLDEEDKKKPG